MSIISDFYIMWIRNNRKNKCFLSFFLVLSWLHHITPFSIEIDQIVSYSSVVVSIFGYKFHKTNTQNNKKQMKIVSPSHFLKKFPPHSILYPSAVYVCFCVCLSDKRKSQNFVLFIYMGVYVVIISPQLMFHFVCDSVTLCVCECVDYINSKWEPMTKKSDSAHPIPSDVFFYSFFLLAPIQISSIFIYYKYNNNIINNLWILSHTIHNSVQC